MRLSSPEDGTPIQASVILIHEMCNHCTEDPKSNPIKEEERVRELIGKALCILMNLHPSSHT